MLRRLRVNGSPTKVVVLGIGGGVNLPELRNIASAPVERNVIRVHNFSSLSDVEEQLRNTSCDPPGPGNSTMSRIFIYICQKITVEVMLFLNELLCNYNMV